MQIDVNEAQFLEQIENDTYRQTLQELFEACRGLGLFVGRGKVGLTIRLITSGRKEPLTIAWLFPQGVSGWMGLLDLTLGFDRTSANNVTPAAASALEDYVVKVEALQGVDPTKPDWLRGYHLNPDTVIRHRHQITDIMAELVLRVGEEDQ